MRVQRNDEEATVVSRRNNRRGKQLTLETHHLSKDDVGHILLRDNTNTENVRRNKKETQIKTVKKAPRVDQIRFQNAMKRQKEEQRRIQNLESEKTKAKRRQTMGMSSSRAKSREATKSDGDNFLNHAKSTVRKSRKRMSLLPSTLKQPLRQRRRQSTGAITGSLLKQSDIAAKTTITTTKLGPPRRK